MAQPSIGILMLDTRFPRLVGDLGHPGTFPFPVRHQRVPGASPERVVRGAGPALLPPFVDGARALVRQGARAIVTTCGFLSVFQAELATAVPVPVLTSSLLLVPVVARLLGPARAVGILTIDGLALGRAHLAGAGIDPGMRVVIQGLAEDGAFARAILGDRTALDVAACRAEHRDAARRLVAAHPELGAIVLECTNMPPYRADVQAVTGLPVFDAVDLVRLVHASLPAEPA